MNPQRLAQRDNGGPVTRALSWWYALDRGWRAAALGATIVLGIVLAHALVG